MVVAGDNSYMESVAPFLKPIWNQLSYVGSILRDYDFGTARYRRTKVLSWLASMLLVDSMTQDGPKRLSTARHTDALLERIENNVGDPLRADDTCRQALLLMFTGMEAHAAVSEAWDPKFKDSRNGAKWQELQLVGTLLGVTIAAASLGSESQSRLVEVAPRLRELTASRDWQRPSKTQTATQWAYIAQVALGVVRAMGIDAHASSDILVRRFGYSCVPTLEAVAASAS